MQYTVPKFIEHEPKIVGPFTFQQFVYVGIAGAFCFLLYFLAPYYIFWLGVFVLGGGALALAFLKIGGRSLPEVIKNFLVFYASPKVYRWKRGLPPKVIKVEKPKKEVEKEEPPPKIGGESKLQKLFTQVETKTK